MLGMGINEEFPTDGFHLLEHKLSQSITRMTYQLKILPFLDRLVFGQSQIHKPKA